MNRKFIGLGIIFIVLLVAPFLYRQLLYGSGDYTPPEIVNVDSEQIKAQLAEYSAFTEQATGHQGRVIIDLSHNNNVEMTQLAPLRDRLTVRGVRVDVFTGEQDTLKKALRSATALLVLAPTSPYDAEERQLISKFVEDGGQLLLGADPILPVDSNQGLVDFLAALVPNSGYPAINSLAAEFDAIYFNDYVYNLENTTGNYRHVQFTELDRQNPLTKGLDNLVFFISHSLHSESVKLIGGDQNTLSSLRPGETNLVAGTLSNEGKVLALGDVTFLTPPYYTMGDNDQFLSRLADWLAVDQRERGIEDFPYLFSRAVDLVQINQELIDGDLISRMQKVQELFKQNDILISLRDRPNPKNDVLYVGSYQDVELVQDLLLAAGVTIDNGDAKDESAESSDSTEEEEQEQEQEQEQDQEQDQSQQQEDQEQDQSEQEEDQSSEQENQEQEQEQEQDQSEQEEDQSSEQQDQDQNQNQEQNQEQDQEQEISPSEAPTDTTSLPNLVQVSYRPSNAQPASQGIAPRKNNQGPIDRLKIEGLGVIDVKDTILFVLDDSNEESFALITLAENVETALDALEQLNNGTLSNCIFAESATICAKNDANVEENIEVAEEDDSEAASSSATNQGDIFILANDDGVKGSRTNVEQLKNILSQNYDIKVWSVKENGVPTSADVQGYKMYIIDSGDYAADSKDIEILSVFTQVKGGIMFMGAQAIQQPTDKQGLLDELEIVNDQHPLTSGNKKGDKLKLNASESGVASILLPTPQENEQNDVTILLARPTPEQETGAPIMVAYDKNLFGKRGVVASFALYQLPDNFQNQIVTQAVQWMIGE
ncbi:MAG: hypothetical protein ACPGWR_20790 [Ardenticatenaceae bacterium]